MALVDDLNAALAHIAIGFPLRDWQASAVFVEDIDGATRMRLRLSMPDRDTGARFDGLESTHELPAVEYLRERLRVPARLAGFVRAALIERLTHEIEESILVDGVRLFEPRHWGAVAARGPR